MYLDDNSKDTLKLAINMAKHPDFNISSYIKRSYASKTWCSPGFIEGDRSLDINERIDIFLISQANGKTVENFFWWPADKTAADAGRWPKELAQSLWINGKQLSSGEEGKDTIQLAGASSTNLSAMALRNRYWYESESNRAFSTHPHKNNWDQCFDLAAVDLSADAKIEIQVKDRKTSTLLETNVFTPTPNRLKASEWSVDIGKQINSRCKMIRAGKYDTTNRISPSAIGSGIWVPKNSDLILTIASTGTVLPAPSTAKSDIFNFGYDLTLPSESALPDMTGFEQDELGIPANSWLSPNYLLSDRDLAVGEKLYTWLIRCSDGQPLEQVTFTAQANNCLKAQWPQQLAKSINANARHLRAGGWNDKGEFTDLAGSGTNTEFATLNLIEKSRLNRLWHYSRDNRTFSTAPFSNNWVQTLLFANLPLEADTTLCVQVRDITSQYLYETHLFTPTASRLSGAQWPKDLCGQINRDSKMLLAGVKASGTGRISAAEKDNALWIPQCSDLAVTVQPVIWLTEQTIKAERDLAVDESIYTYVWDEYSSVELITPHCFTPANAEERKRQNWPGSWAKSLNASTLKPYVRLGSSKRGSTDPGKDATEATLWQLGTALKVFTTEPSDKNWLTFSTPSEQVYKNRFSSVEIRLVNELTQRVVYRMQSRTHSADWLTDATSWWKKTAQVALARLKRDGKSFIQIPAIPAASVRVPRLSGLSIVIEPSKPITSQEAEAWKIIETLKNLQTMEDKNKGDSGAVLFLKQKENMNEILYDFTQKKLDTYTALTYSAFQSSARPSGYMSYLDTANKIAHALEKKEQDNKNPDERSMIITSARFTAPLSYPDAASQSLIYNHIDNPQALSSIGFDSVKNLLQRCYSSNAQAAILVEKELLLMKLMELISTSYKTPRLYLSALELFRFIIRSDASDALTFLEREDKSATDVRLDGKRLAAFIKLTMPSPTLNVGRTPSLPATSAYQILYNQNSLSTFTLRLTPSLRMKGVRLLLQSTTPVGYELFDIHVPKGIDIGDVPLAYSGVSHAGNIWDHPGTLPYKAPLPDELPVPDSPLCEDYGNTFRSEVFDVNGQNMTGVDPRTGLFNAHYSIATLTDLEGKGPAIDLTLRYSPLRANEAGLGDGWAFNFSWYDSRQRLLTLSTGQTIQFTADEMANLKAGKTVDRPICQTTAKTATVNKQQVIQSLDVRFPSGRKEVLAVGDGDATEHNAEFVKGMIARLEEAKKQIPLFIQSKKPVLGFAWYDKLAEALFDIFDEDNTFTRARTAHLEELKKWQSYWANRLSELQHQVVHELDYWQTPDQQLIPARITSPLGGELTFNWQRKQGQYLLKKVSAGDKTLLTGTYTDSAVRGASAITSTVTFTLWPGTSESAVVQLDLQNYLLDVVSRSTPNDKTVLERVQYGYGLDPTLERVLTSITESDGSLEKVFYEAEGMQFPAGGNWKPALPRVRTHVISPGVDRPGLRTDWQYSEHNFLGYTSTRGYNRFEDTAAEQGVAYIYTSTATQYQGVSIKRSWNGLHLQTEERETAPGGASKITQWTFGSAKQLAPSFGSPTSIRTIYQDA